MYRSYRKDARKSFIYSTYANTRGWHPQKRKRSEGRGENGKEAIQVSPSQLLQRDAVGSRSKDADDQCHPDHGRGQHRENAAHSRAD